MRDEKEKLERQLLKATGAERARIVKRLAELGGRRGAEHQLRGQDKETR